MKKSKKKSSFCPRCDKDGIVFDGCKRIHEKQCEIIYHCKNCNCDYLLFSSEECSCDECAIGELRECLRGRK